MGFTVLARGWSALAGIGTLTLIARCLSPVQQGFYYTFYSLVALQIVFELGFSVVILQTASHEAAHLHIAPDGSITGPEAAHGRLASVLQKSVRWYTAAAVLMGCIVLPTGMHFFRANSLHAAGAPVHWMLPWCLVVLSTCFTFQVDPVFSFLEGCGFVPQVARTRLMQAMTGVLLGWGALYFGHGLFAPGLMIGGQALAGIYFVFTRRRLLLPLLRHSTHHFRVNWGSEVWPFQWRIAVSWVCGYFIFQTFTPILFKTRSAIEAGQMGMTMNVCGTLSGMAISWLNTKSAPFGRMVARRQYADLDHSFSRALTQAVTAAIVGCFAVWLGVYVLGHHGVRIAQRLLPPVPLAMMLTATVLNIVVFGEAIYLRAHKQEKFMTNALLFAMYAAPAAFFAGRSMGPHGGAWGIAATYLLGALVIGIGHGTWVFAKYRRLWHV